MKKVKLNKYLIVTISLFLVFTINNYISAHHLWIEGDTNVQSGEEITLQFFWGHPGYDLEDLRTTELRSYLQSPDGIVKLLTLSDKDNYLEAAVETYTGGDHQFYTYRPAFVYQGRLNQFTSKKIVNVSGGNEIEAWNKAAELPLEIIPQDYLYHLHTGDDLEIKILYKGEALANTNIKIISSENNQVFESEKTNEKGIVTITLFEGKNILEVEKEINSKGVWNGNQFESVIHIHSMFLETHSH